MFFVQPGWTVMLKAWAFPWSIWPSGWGHSSKQGRVWWTDPFDSRYTNILLDIFVQLNSLPSTSIDLYVVCFATLGGSAVRSSRQEKWKGTFSQSIAYQSHSISLGMTCSRFPSQCLKLYLLAAVSTFGHFWLQPVIVWKVKRTEKAKHVRCTSSEIETKNPSYILFQHTRYPLVMFRHVQTFCVALLQVPTSLFSTATCDGNSHDLMSEVGN